MAKQIRTDLVIVAETKGLDKALQQVLGLNEENVKALKEQAAGFGAVQKSITATETKVKGLLKQQLALTAQLEQVGDKGSDAYKALKAELHATDEEARRLNRSLQIQQKLHADEAQAAARLARAQEQIRAAQMRAEEKARGAFAQGFMQTAMPPGLAGMAPLFLERGPGMRQQALGQLAGAAALRTGQAAWGMTGGAAFTGLQGMQQGIVAIPIIGGAAAGQLGAAAGYAGQALAYQRQRVDLAPYFSETAQTRVTRQRSEFEVRETEKAEQLARLRAGPANPFEMARRMQQEGELQLQPGGPFAGMTAGKLWLRRKKQGDLFAEQLGQYQENQQKEIIRQIETRQTVSGRQRQGQPIQIPAPKFDPWQKVISPVDIAAETGARLRGLARPEATREAAALFQAAGGRFGGGIGGMPAQERFLRAGMAAQTLFGAGPEVTGAFGLAGRRGGLTGVGNMGAGADALAQAIGDATALGLEDSEVAQYLQRIASGIQNFQQTGIPMNSKSLGSLAQMLGERGIQAGRAQTVAQSFMNYVQQIPTRGPTGGFDYALLQILGGYKGGGPEELEKAYGRLETMTSEDAGAAMQQVIQFLSGQAGGGAMGRGFFRRQLAAKGIALSTAETRQLGMQPEELTAEERAGVEAEVAKRETVKASAAAAGRGTGTVAELEAVAAGRITGLGPNLRAQAALTEQQLMVGNKMVDLVITLEKSAVNTNTAFANLANPTLTNLSKAIEGFTQKLADWTLSDTEEEAKGKAKGVRGTK